MSTLTDMLERLSHREPEIDLAYLERRLAFTTHYLLEFCQELREGEAKGISLEGRPVIVEDLEDLLRAVELRPLPMLNANQLFILQYFTKFFEKKHPMH